MTPAALPVLDGLRFRAAAISSSAQVDSETTFLYGERDGAIWAEYRGGTIARGFLVGTRSGDRLSFRYVHLDIDGHTASGRCESIIEQGVEGLVLEETWAWESRPGSGSSTLVEVPGSHTTSARGIER